MYFKNIETRHQYVGITTEQFSIECCKTKTKVITWTNHKKRKKTKTKNKPIRTRREKKKHVTGQARENGQHCLRKLQVALCLSVCLTS